MTGIGSDPKYKIVYSQSCDWLREKAITVMESALQAVDKIDVVYGHNAAAAIGAYVAAENAGREKEMRFIGIDGLPTPDGDLREVMAGRMELTYVYPTGGTEAIESAYRLLVKGEKLEKEVTLDSIEVTKDNAEEVLKQLGGA
jgi:ribose transport system substrate-binding protein